MKLLTAFRTFTICLAILTMIACKDSANSEDENKAIESSFETTASPATWMTVSVATSGRHRLGLFN